MAKEPKAVLGPDNNKRLAILEDLFRDLAAGLQLPAESAADEVAIAVLTRLSDKAQRIIELEQLEVAFSASTDKLIAGLSAAGIAVPEGADLDALILDAIAKGPDTASDGEVAAIARAEAAETELGTVKIELAGAIEDLDIANSKANEYRARIADLESGRVIPSPTPAGAVHAEPEAEPKKAKRRDRPEGARDFGPKGNKKGRPTFADLADPETELELVFSNGDYELIELAPIAIKASDLTVMGSRRIVNKPILIRGGDDREDLHGVALLYQGEQVDYCQFAEPIALEAKQERQFVKAIFFG